MMRAYHKDEAFLEEVRNMDLHDDSIALWWLGQSGYLIKWKHYHILIDPYLSDSLTIKYQNTDKPHVRMTERVVDPRKLDFVDLVTSSHNHTDHLDSSTLEPLSMVNVGLRMVAPRANQEMVRHRSSLKTGSIFYLNEEETVFFPGGLSITGVCAAHNRLDKDPEGNCLYMGFLFRFGDMTMYHSGDTLWHERMVDFLKEFKKIDIAILPINGNKPERRVAGNLDAAEAVNLAKQMNASVLIPCHYHMFEFNTVDPDEFEVLAKSQSQNYVVLKNGQGFTYP